MSSVSKRSTVSSKVTSTETVSRMVSVGVVVTVKEMEMLMGRLIKSRRVSVGVNSMRFSVISSVTSTVAVVSKTCGVSVTVAVFVSVTVTFTVVDKMVPKSPDPMVMVASSKTVVSARIFSVTVGVSKVKKPVKSSTVSVLML